MKKVNKIILILTSSLLIASCGCNSKKKDTSVKFQELEFDRELDSSETQSLITCLRNSIATFSKINITEKHTGANALSQNSEETVSKNIFAYSGGVFESIEDSSSDKYENGISFNTTTNKTSTYWYVDNSDYSYCKKVEETSINKTDADYSYTHYLIEDEIALRKSLLSSYIFEYYLTNFKGYKRDEDFFLVYSLKNVEEMIMEAQSEGTNLRRRVEEDIQTIVSFTHDISNNFLATSFTHFYEKRENYDPIHDLYYDALTVSRHDEVRIEASYDSGSTSYNGTHSYPSEVLKHEALLADEYAVTFDEEGKATSVIKEGSAIVKDSHKQTSNSSINIDAVVELEAGKAYTLQQVADLETYENEIVNHEEFVKDIPNLEDVASDVGAKYFEFEGVGYMLVKEKSRIRLTYTANYRDSSVSIDNLVVYRFDIV